MIVLTLCAHRGLAAEDTLNVRVDWGGPSGQTWEGVIAVSEGSLSDPRPLGIEADEPGSMWLDHGPLLAPATGPNAQAGPEMDQLVIRSRSPRTYDGVDFRVTAPREAKLVLAFRTSRAATPPHWVDIPLAELIDHSRIVDLDDRGARLMARRAPGDQLRVAVKRESLVFRPGETLEIDVEPCLLPVEPGTKLKLRTELLPGRGDKGQLVREDPFVAGEGKPVQLKIPLPDQEGVYDLMLTAAHADWRRWTQPVRGQSPVAERRVQVLVLSPEAPTVAREAFSAPRQIEEINPANPRWWDEQLAKWGEHFSKLPRPRRLPRLWKGPLGNGYSHTREHPLGEIVELGPCPDPNDVAWEAYTLPVQQPEAPHVLEVDYPSDVPQTMGISVIEPNAAGALVPIGLDSGVELAEEVAGDSRDPRWLTHRVIFWPKTKSPLVLITDRRDRSPALYGKIRVLALGEHLPPFSTQGTQPERLLGAYLDRPLFPENFSASRSIASSSEPVDDWVTFYEAGKRLVEYLNHVGFNGLMVSVLADGSTIYPSAVLERAPRYDTGVFQQDGQDPVCKDVLEMLLRLFDRQGLELVPAMQFSSPLAELEAELRRGGSAAEGICWVGPEGKTWLETRRPVRGMAPFYNVLHPRVQEAMLAAVREVAGRYGRHPSFAGLAIQLSAQGYAQLPGPTWGMDDVTIARFERDTQIKVPGEGPDRFAQRARFLSEERLKEWLQWRADLLGQFYGRVQAELIAAQPDARLYLAGADMLSGDQLQRELQPALPREMAITEAMLRVGIDARLYDEAGIVLLRPERIAPQWSLARQAAALEIQQMMEIEHRRDMRLPFEGSPIPGSLFFHEPQELRLASFDEKSPFQPAYTWLAAQPVPSAWQNRRRFVHSLAALDSQVMFDGGWQLPLGEEDWLRDVVAVYRRLPAIPFQRLADQSGSDVAQPLCIRYASHEGATYVYVVNDAPFAATARLDFACPSECEMQELSGVRQVPALTRDASGTSWTVELGPYDLVAVRFSAPQVTITRARVQVPAQVEAELKAKIDDLKNRAATVSHAQLPSFQALENPGFDRPAAADGEIPGWTRWTPAGSAIELDGTQKHSGGQAVRMTSRGAGARLTSRPFDPPTTGRLTMAVWLRGADGPSPAQVRYVLEGEFRGEPFIRWQTCRLGPQWQPFVVEAADLPLAGLSRLQVRFDLLGPGEAWIDDVQFCAVVFSQAEKNALLKLIEPANVKLDRGQVRDCLQLLEGYWPRFLAENVPIREPSVVRRPRPPADRPPETEESPGVVDRMKAFVPKRIRSLF